MGALWSPAMQLEDKQTKGRMMMMVFDMCTNIYEMLERSLEEGDSMPYVEERVSRVLLEKMSEDMDPVPQLKRIRQVNREISDAITYYGILCRDMIAEKFVYRLLCIGTTFYSLFEKQIELDRGDETVMSN